MALYEQLLSKMDGRQYSNYFVAFCPFHDNHNTPALFVYEEDGRYRCASCGAKGSLQYLAKKVGTHFQVTQRQKSNILPRWKRWENEYGDLQGIVEHAHKVLVNFPQYQGYLRRRKLDEYINQGYFGFCDGWLILPVRDNTGKIVDAVARAISGKGTTRYVVHPNPISPSRPLYSPSWKKVIESDTVWITYGMFDSWAMHSIGLACITGITGQSLSAELLKPLGKRLIIVPDADESHSAHKLANNLGWRCSVKEIKYPDGTKDVQGIREKYGNEVLSQLVH